VAERGATCGATLALKLMERIHDVAQEMESISNLDGFGCA
jgi:hypothetical protein